ncbi:MAG: hypothetical protein P9L91_04165 [Candidatus Zophobacter franzmannii]|nr:hypothetical protein [Candidatus Zophobacter franzmannii]
MKYGILILTILTILLVACDNRTIDPAELSFSVVDDTLYNDTNYNTSPFTVTLTGEPELIMQKFVYFVYDHDQVTVLGGASDEYVQTDNNGEANGTIYSRLGFVGDIVIEATHDSQSVSQNLTVLDMPEILYFVSDINRLLADGHSYARLRVKIDRKLDPRKDQVVIFKTSVGRVSPDSLVVDERGVAITTFYAPTEPEVAFISAKLKTNPKSFKRLYIPCE